MIDVPSGHEVWLERLLGQANSDDVGELLNRITSDQLLISDFSFHSICVILARLERTGALADFVQDIFVNGAVGLASVRPEKINEVLSTMSSFKLDFDDAYQYIAAEQNDLILISFDSDFDRSTRGRKTPTEILSSI